MKPNFWNLFMKKLTQPPFAPIKESSLTQMSLESCLSGSWVLADVATSHIQFPIPLQRGLLNSLLSQEQMERIGNCIGTFSKLLRQVSHVDDHISRWVALMNALSILGNFVGQRTQFLLAPALGRFGSRLIGFKDPHADRRDSNSGNCR